MNSIKSYVIEIVVILLFIGLTSMLWVTNNNNVKAKELANNNNLAVELVENNTKPLYPMNDDYAYNNVDESVLRVSNYNSDDINYKLVMQVKKGNEIDYDMLKMKVNNDVFNLDSKYLYEDDTYLYFDLTHQFINKYDNIDFAMWLDEEVDNPSNYTFVYNFYVEKI